MNLTKEEIKAWLKEFGHSREWLGQQCGGLSKNTVNNWLSTSISIPDGSLALIARLIADDHAAEARRQQQLAPDSQIFSVEVDLPTFRAYCQAALAERLILEDWAIHTLNVAAGVEDGIPAAEFPEHEAPAPLAALPPAPVALP